MNFEKRPATVTDLETIWQKNIENNPGDDRWIAWRAEAMENNRTGRSQTFVVLYNGDPVGEGTLLFSEECKAIRGRTALACRGITVNINALRIQKEYEGQGHISDLVHQMEQYARSLGYTSLTIGVEAKETRNLAIYLHWGYSRFLLSEVEDGELVLYYEKELL